MLHGQRSPYPLTSDILLRDVIEVDLPSFFDQQLDPEVNRMAAFTARNKDAFMANWTRILVQCDETITIKTILFDGHAAGNVASIQRSVSERSATGSGRDTGARALLPSTLEVSGSRKGAPLCARVAKHNLASTRVLQKCGFRISSEHRAPPDMRGEEVEELILKLET
jgi:hypothetical protein